MQHNQDPAESAATTPPRDSFEIAAAADDALDQGGSIEPPAAATDVAVPDWTLPTQESQAEFGPNNSQLPASEMAFPTQTSPLPELEIASGPATDFAAADFAAQQANSFEPPAENPATAALENPATATLENPATAALGNPVGMPDPQSPSSPENLLRGAPGDANLLRMNPDTAEARAVESWGSEPTDRQPQFEAAPEPGSAAFQANPLAPPAAANQLYQPQSASDPGLSAPPLMSGSNYSGYPNATDPQSAGLVAMDPSITIDAPGDRRLEGAQTPSVVIQKRAPSEVKVGQVATFAIHVQNVGAVEALDVTVQDKIPSGMRLIDASPKPAQQGNALMWQLGAMPAGDERTVTLQLVPEQEGELGSVARVSFEAAASVRTISTRPELKIVQKAPETVLIGQQLEIELEVSNPGTGEATNVVLQEDVPEGLEHPKGRQLDNGLGNLAPGEVRRQVLRMRAVAPGIIQNTIRLTGDDGLSSEHTVAVQVVAPELRVELEGPSRRFLERQATYYVHLGNVGTADATNVELSVQLDRGFTFVSTENQGQYDPSRHSVHWSLAQLSAGATGKVALTLLPVQEGEQAIMLDARADLGVVAKGERQLSVEGFSELSFSITNPGGPIELGSETNYEIKVNNSGSKADSNVRVQVLLPPGLELISSDGDAGTDGRGLIAFQPKSTLSPGSEQAYRIRVRGVAPGTHIVKAVVVSDLATTPVTKEESTVVYADQ